MKLSKVREEFAKTVANLQKNVNQLMIQNQTPQPKANPAEEEPQADVEEDYKECIDPQSKPI